jgi:hypothetical protein
MAERTPALPPLPFGHSTIPIKELLAPIPPSIAMLLSLTFKREGGDADPVVALIIR